MVAGLALLAIVAALGGGLAAAPFGLVPALGTGLAFGMTVPVVLAAIRFAAFQAQQPEIQPAEARITAPSPRPTAGFSGP